MLAAAAMIQSELQTYQREHEFNFFILSWADSGNGASALAAGVLPLAEPNIRQVFEWGVLYRFGMKGSAILHSLNRP